MLKTRVISAAILIPTVFAVLLLGGWPLIIGVGLCALVCSVELLTVGRTAGYRPLMVAGAVGAVALAVDSDVWRQPLLVLAVVLLSLVLAQRLRGATLRLPGMATAGQALRRIIPSSLPREEGVAEPTVPHPRPEQSILMTLAVVAYIGGLLRFAILIVTYHRRPEGVIWAVLLLLGVWGCDSGAYFAGRYLGRRRFFPNISPKKTLEGAIGGLLTAVTAGIVVGAPFLGLSPWAAALTGLGVGVAAIAGDLCESLLKRGFGVKDAGWIIPGHGGLLDRVDSMLFALPVVYVAARLLHG